MTRHQRYRKAGIGLAAVLLGMVCAGCPALLGITWHSFLGTDADNAAYAIAKTSEGGYILAGFSEATAETSNNAHLTKINGSGAIEWQADFGDDRDDSASAVAQTADGGYIVAGQFGDEKDPISDAFLLKTDATGTEEWRKLFDSGGQDRAVSVEPTTDGGYLLGLDLDLLNTADATMVKTDASGVEVWRIAGPEGTHAAKAIQTKDGGCILAWWQLVPGAQAGSASGKIGLLKTDAAGQKTWDVTLNDDQAIDLGDIRETADGGLILAGQLNFLGNDSQIFLWKTDASGAPDWRSSFGDSGRNAAHAIRETSDGSFIVAGETYPVGRQTDALLLKTSVKGVMQWLRFYGGEDREMGYDVVETADGGYLLAGSSESTGNEGKSDQSDIFLVKTDREGNSEGAEVQN